MQRDDETMCNRQTTAPYNTAPPYSSCCGGECQGTSCGQVSGLLESFVEEMMDEEDDL